MNRYDFPQTPARVQLSLWPGGLESNAKGTIDWAGGVVDWNAQDIKDYGYYFATLGEVSIGCYQTNTPPGTNKGKSYYYSDAKGTNDTVVDGDKTTTLKSLLGSGIDMNKDYPSSAGASQTLQVIPGLVGGGIGTNGQAAGDANGGSSSGSGSVTAAASTCLATGFQQSCKTNEGVGQERALGASAFAALIAIAGTLWI